MLGLVWTLHVEIEVLTCDEDGSFALHFLDVCAFLCSMDLKSRNEEK